MRLCSSDASDTSHGAGSRSAHGLGSVAVACYCALDGGTFERVWAVVVADEDVAVDVAEADVVVSVLLARVDAGLVAGQAGVYDAGRGG
jgi:hypothetical protein